jgi:hypothetical protein
LYGAAFSTQWREGQGAVVEQITEEVKSFDWSFYMVIITIFACGALLGGLIGYLIAFIKYHKTMTPNSMRSVEQQTAVPTLQVDVDRDELYEPARRSSTKTRRSSKTSASMRSRFPDMISITKRGLGDSHVYHREDCHVLRSGNFSDTNTLFRKCAICFE